MMRWYVVQVYAGYEKHFVEDLQRSIQKEGLSDYFGEILIPEAKLKSFFDIAHVKGRQQLFPGYVLINMEMMPRTKQLILSCPRRLRFLGGIEPAALTQKEVNHIFAQMAGEAPVFEEKESFVIGSKVEIKEGPFAGFDGIIDKVDKDGEKLIAMVSIFGRMTPVELNFHQVKQ